VGLSWDALAELLLFTKAHYEAWLAAWYLSQTHTQPKKAPAQAKKAPETPKSHPAPVFQPQFTVPEYSAMTLF